MHPTYKRMLAGLKKKATASRRKKASAGKGDTPPLWSLYILKCCDGSFYTGITTDLERRFKMHQSGKASRYTRSHGPVEMLYSEPCGDRSSALVRECEVKEWPRGKKERLIAGEKIPKRKKRKRKARMS